MPRPRKPVARRDWHLVLDGDLAELAEGFLRDSGSGRMPFAAKQRFVSQLMREFFARETIDLGTYFSDVMPGSVVHGLPPVIAVLKEALEAK